MKIRNSLFAEGDNKSFKASESNEYFKFIVYFI